MTVALALSLGLFAIGFADMLTRRLAWHTRSGVLALADASYTVHCIHEGHLLGAVMGSIGTAWMAYQWWTGGGGDGTRRRLRHLRRRFTGVRRTAPQAA